MTSNQTKEEEEETEESSSLNPSRKRQFSAVSRSVNHIYFKILAFCLVLAILLVFLQKQASINKSRNHVVSMNYFDEDYMEGNDTSDQVPEPSELAIPTDLDLPGDEGSETEDSQDNLEFEAEEEELENENMSFETEKNDDVDDNQNPENEQSENMVQSNEENKLSSSPVQFNDNANTTLIFENSRLKHLTCIPKMCIVPKHFITKPGSLAKPNNFVLLSSYPGSGNTWVRTISKFLKPFFQ